MNTPPIKICFGFINYIFYLLKILEKKKGLKIWASN
jgi:hypothetical protein